MDRTERSSRQLPPGRHGLSRAYVAQHQRERIFAAVAETVDRIGYGKLTVDDIVVAASVSKRTFYQHFAGKEEAFLATYDAVTDRLVQRVRQTQQSDLGPVERIEAALRTVLDALAESPAEAKLCVVEVLCAGRNALERRNATLTQLRDAVASACALVVARDGRQAPPRIAAETVVGGLVEVVYGRLLRDDAAGLPDLLPDLAYCTLLPYLGPVAATEEHSRLSAARNG